MKHYDYLEWVFYKEKVLSKEKFKEMEEHLYECNECMDIFLSLIDSKEIDGAEKTIPHDFTNKVMKDIQKVKFKPKAKVQKNTISFKNAFGYYAAVAAVAIILTWGGFYSGLVDVLPQVAKETAQKNRFDTPSIVSSFTEKIVNKTSNFVNDFQISSGKEELK
jgi:hypothetical protein